MEYTGYIAAFLTTVAFLPQAIKTLKTRDTSSLSLAMYSLFTLGVFFWLLYGFVLDEYAIILANAITLALSISILAVKIVNKINQKE